MFKTKWQKKYEELEESIEYFTSLNRRLLNSAKEWELKYTDVEWLKYYTPTELMVSNYTLSKSYLDVLRDTARRIKEEP